MVSQQYKRLATGLMPGVNEKDFSGKVGRRSERKFGST